MLLACLPLLLPPGLCACGASEAVTPKHANTAAHAKETPARKCCGCSHHAKSDATPTRRLATSTQHTPEHPVHHAPGCPATTGSERAKFTERAELVDHLTAVAFVTLAHQPTLANVDCPVFADARSTPIYESQPRYLKHCALLF